MEEHEDEFFRRKTWWLSNSRYSAYFLRELSGIVLAAYAVLFVYGIYSQTSVNPVFGWVAFSFAIIHSVTWFKSLSRIAGGYGGMKIGNTKLNTNKVFAAVIFLWLAASYVILTVLFGGMV